jgi:hypothetical protein
VVLCRLAASADVVGVIIGSIIGHAACTGAAVLGGKHLAAHIDERTVGVSGGLHLIGVLDIAPDLKSMVHPFKDRNGMMGNSISGRTRFLWRRLGIMQPPCMRRAESAGVPFSRGKLTKSCFCMSLWSV